MTPYQITQLERLADDLHADKRKTEAELIDAALAEIERLRAQLRRLHLQRNAEDGESRVTRA